MPKKNNDKTAIKNDTLALIAKQEAEVLQLTKALGQKQSAKINTRANIGLEQAAYKKAQAAAIEQSEEELEQLTAKQEEELKKLAAKHKREQAAWTKKRKVRYEKMDNKHLKTIANAERAHEQAIADYESADYSIRPRIYALNENIERLKISLPTAKA